MTLAVHQVEAEVFSCLPDDLRYTGAPSDWAEMTRPGRMLHSFLESPFFDERGDLWLSDVAVGRIFRICRNRSWTVEHQYKGAPHAMRFLPDGRVLIADYFEGLGTLDRQQFTPHADGIPGVPFLGLSDMAMGDDGKTVWVTDSGRSSLTDARGRLWRMDAEGELRLVLSDMPYPNGVALSPDGKLVYVAVTRANQIWRTTSDLPPSGQPMAGVFLHLSGGLGPDGLATNSLGWLAIAQAQAGRAYVTDVLGDPVATVRLPHGMWTTSVAFAPDNPFCLYIVEAEHGIIYRADLSPGKRTT